MNVDPADLEAVAAQLGRTPRGVLEISYRCPDGAPGVMLGSLPADRLTRQQRNILRLLVEGHSNREIGERMFLSANTVKDYLDDLMEKTEIHSRTALVAQAARLGIVVSDSDRIQK